MIENALTPIWCDEHKNGKSVIGIAATTKTNNQLIDCKGEN